MIGNRFQLFPMFRLDPIGMQTLRFHQPHLFGRGKVHVDARFFHVDRNKVHFPSRAQKSEEKCCIMLY